MGTVKARRFSTQEAACAHLNAALATGDHEKITAALRDVCLERGLRNLARIADLDRGSLYNALAGKQMPGFRTVLKLMSALGLTMAVTPGP